ncbi:nucleotide-binding alpha-beta plait domain-containing protein [Tanacetum coccineum]
MEIEYQEGGWQKVKRKQRGNNNNNNPNHQWKNQAIPNMGGKPRPTDFDKVMRDKATSFFFTNFPDSWDSSALRRMFSRYGKVVNVYIAFKRMKKDTRFGFVRYINFGHLETFERRLKEIMIGDSRLVINRAKNFKGGDVAFPPSDLPPCNTGGFHKVKATKTHFFHSFKEALSGPKHQVHYQIKNIVTGIKEDGYIRSRLELCWTGNAKNFKVLQNAWIILENNGLLDSTSKSLEENKIWLHDIKPWDEDGETTGRLTWLHIEGLPSLGRNLGAIKFVLNEFGRVLEIGSLDFDSKLLLPIKTLALLNNMNEIGFNLANLISTCSSSDDGSYFEEEFVGPTINLGDGGDDVSGRIPFEGRDIERPPFVQSSCKVFEVSRSEGYEGNNHCENIKDSFSISYNSSQKDRKSKQRHKKKKLVVGGNSSPLGLMSQKDKDFPTDGDAATKCIGISLNPNGLGASGGILTMWDSRVFTLEQCFKERNYLGVIGSWASTPNKIGLLNVYAPQPSSSKRAVGAFYRIPHTNANLVVFGDFNVMWLGRGKNKMGAILMMVRRDHLMTLFLV